MVGTTGQEEYGKRGRQRLVMGIKAQPGRARSFRVLLPSTVTITKVIHNMFLTEKMVNVPPVRR